MTVKTLNFHTNFVFPLLDEDDIDYIMFTYGLIDEDKINDTQFTYGQLFSIPARINNDTDTLRTFYEQFKTIEAEKAGQIECASLRVFIGAPNAHVLILNQYNPVHLYIKAIEKGLGKKYSKRLFSVRHTIKALHQRLPSEVGLQPLDQITVLKAAFLSPSIYA